MSERIRVGLVGNPLRSWLSQAHVPALQALPQYSITAVCTTRMESALAAAKEIHAAHAFTDVRAMARHEDVDLIVVAVRTPSHYDPIMAAFDAGKHVFGEWPLGVRRDQTQELAETAQRANVRHMVGLQARGSAVINRLKDLIAAGYVGRVLSCNVFASETALNAAVGADRAWASDLTGSESLLTIATGHALDTIRYCLGGFDCFSGAIATQFAQQTIIETGIIIPRNVPDQIMLCGRLRSGAMVSLHLQDGAASGTGIRFEVSGTDGVLVVSSDEHTGLQIAPLRLQGARQKDAILEDLAVPESYWRAPRSIRAQAAANVAELYVSLADCIRNGGDASPDFQDALSLHHLYHALKASWDTGERKTSAL